MLESMPPNEQNQSDLQGEAGKTEPEDSSFELSISEDNFVREPVKVSYKHILASSTDLETECQGSSNNETVLLRIPEIELVQAELPEEVIFKMTGHGKIDNMPADKSMQPPMTNKETKVAVEEQKGGPPNSESDFEISNFEASEHDHASIGIEDESKALCNTKITGDFQSWENSLSLEPIPSVN